MTRRNPCDICARRKLGETFTVCARHLDSAYPVAPITEPWKPEPQPEPQKPRNPADSISGQRFGKWTVLRLGPPTQSRTATWMCRCECGRESPVLPAALRSGRSTQCKPCSGIARRKTATSPADRRDSNSQQARPHSRAEEKAAEYEQELLRDGYRPEDARSRARAVYGLELPRDVSALPRFNRSRFIAEEASSRRGEA